MEKFSIGASEAHLYMGKIPNKTAESAVYKKIAKMYGGRVSGDGYMSSEMEWGIVNEEDALKMASFELGLDFYKPDTIYLDEYPIHASPDGFCRATRQVMEIKCPNSDTYIKYIANIFDGETLKATCPEYYWQMQTQMYVFFAKSGYFVAYDPRIKHNPIKYVMIQRNDDDIKEMLEKVVYWDKFAKDIINKIK